MGVVSDVIRLVLVIAVLERTFFGAGLAFSLGSLVLEGVALDLTGVADAVAVLVVFAVLEARGLSDASDSAVRFLGGMMVYRRVLVGGQDDSKSKREKLFKDNQG